MKQRKIQNTMKRMFFLVAASLLALISGAQPVRVVQDVLLGRGCAPRISADGRNVTYLTDLSYSYVEQASDLYVSNENCELRLHQNGSVIRLTPDGAEAHYIWSSVSPDGSKIVYNTAHGTSVCDLRGRVLYRLGQLDAPVWYGNDCIVGMYDESDGHVFTGSSIVMHPLGGEPVILSDKQSGGMYPSVSPQSGRIVYETLGGDIRMMQLNLTDQPVSYVLPAVAEAPAAMQRAPKRVRRHWNSFSDVKIYINPGHGGHTGNDRNIVIYPFQGGDPNGFWESNSNLDKGLKLNEWLQALGMQTMMSRTENEEIDDRALSAIVAEANAYDADFMLSIHSNAGSGTANLVLMLYAGKDANDTYSYPTPTPVSNESRDISTIIATNLVANRITSWSSATPQVVGDKTFGRQAMGWSDGYGVLRRLTVPGVISEGCMHDYYPETYRLMNMDYKWKESFLFMKTFCQYFLNYQLPTGVIMGQVRDGANRQTFPRCNPIRKSRDELDPICRATVELLQNGTVINSYVTDTLYNGIFAFWDLTPGQYQVRTKVDGFYLRQETVDVVANDINYVDLMLNMERQTRPEVLSYSPCVQLTDSQEVKTSVVLNFNWDMWEDPTVAAFHITPAVDGKLEFSNSQHTLTFTPEVAFAPGVEYTVTLDTMACHPDTMFLNHLAQPFTMSFRTKNRTNLRLLQAYPEDNAVDVPLQPTLMFIFDAELASTTSTKVASLFSLTDAAGNTIFTPSVRNFKKNSAPAPYGSARFELPQALEPGATYRFSISKDLKDINGVDFGADRLFTFTTAASSDQARIGDLLIPCDTLSFDVNYGKTLGLATKTLAVEKSRNFEGAASNRLVYSFNATDEDEHIFLQPRDMSHLFTSRDAIALELYGDLSENEVQLEFSVEGDVHLLPLTVLDYAGWRYQYLELTALPEGVEFQFTGIRISRSEAVLSPSGEICIDAVRRINNVTNGVEELEAAEGTQYLLRDNQILIRKADRTYTLTGNCVE